MAITNREMQPREFAKSGQTRCKILRIFSKAMLSKLGFEKIVRQVKYPSHSVCLVHEQRKTELNAASTQKQG